MSEDALADLMPRVSRIVEAEMGLHYPPERWPDLQRGLQAAGSELGYDNTMAFMDWLLSSPLSRREIDALAGALTVGETFFFRDRQTFTALEHDILPPLIEARRSGKRHLRLWSAGCCTGEEPYSLAMLIARLLPDREDWRVTILATDINPRFLQKAAAGVFAEWSFRDVPAWLKDRYFTKTENGRFAILPHVKEMVTFAYLNLAEDVYPSLINGTHAMDIILCRNVLIYLSAEQTKSVIDHFTNSLVPGGWLSVSATETSPTLFSNFSAVNFPGVTLYRKERLPAAPLERVPSPTPPDTAPSDSSALDTSAPEPTACPPEAKTLPDIRAALQWARTSADEGDLQKAQEWCEAAISADKLNPMGYYLRAMILQESGNVEEAVQALKRTLYLNPDFVLAHFTLGSLSQKQGRRKDADKHLDNALDLLASYGADDVLPESEGISAAQMVDMIKDMKESKPE